MRGAHVVWPAIVLMSALSSAGAAQSAGGDGARFAQSPQYPLLPRALEIELALSAARKHGGVTRTTSNPHLMFYGPNLTDNDIGGGRGAFVFMNRVGPDGMMIVPVGQKERDTIVSDAQSLIAQVEQAIGYQAAR